MADEDLRLLERRAAEGDAAAVQALEAARRRVGLLSFFVPGLPAPKGSLRSFQHKGRVVTMEGNRDKVRPWMSSVSLAARDAGARPVDGVVFLGAAFFFPRPKSHFTKKGLRPDADLWHIKKPDADKLVRAILDALTGIAYLDDCQVQLEACPKRYASEAQAPGALVTIRYGAPS